MYRSLLQVVNCFGRPSQENTASASRPSAPAPAKTPRQPEYPPPSFVPEGQRDAVKAESRFCLNILGENVVFLVKKS